MLVPDSQACGNQVSSTTPIPAAAIQAAQRSAAALDAAVARAQNDSTALWVANPWEDWRGGFNLMKDIQRGNTQVAGQPFAGAASQLPGIPPAGSGGSFWDRMRRNVSAGRGRSANARSAQQVKGWDSRFVTGPGGKFEYFSGAGRGRKARGPYGGDSRPGNCGAVDCVSSPASDCMAEPADVVPSDGLSPSGSPVDTGIPKPPPLLPLRDDQPVNIIVPPPPGYGPCTPPLPSGNICLDVKRGAVHQLSVSPDVLYQCSQKGYAGVPACFNAPGARVPVSPADLARLPQYSAGMGIWTDSIAQPGAVPADCATMRTGAAPSSVPWWLWALGGLALLALVSDETKTRRAARARQKPAA